MASDKRTSDPGRARTPDNRAARRPGQDAPARQAPDREAEEALRSEVALQDGNDTEAAGPAASTAPGSGGTAGRDLLHADATSDPTRTPGKAEGD